MIPKGIKLNDPIEKLIQESRIKLRSKISRILVYLQVKTVEDLMSLDTQIILKKPGCGLTTVHEVSRLQKRLKARFQNASNNNGRSNKQTKFQSCSPNEVDSVPLPPPAIETVRSRINLNINSSTEFFDSAKMINEPLEELIRKKCVSLSFKAANVLPLLGVTTVAELLKLDTRKIMNVKGYGLTTFKEVLGVQNLLKSSFYAFENQDQQVGYEQIQQTNHLSEMTAVDVGSDVSYPETDSGKSHIYFTKTNVDLESSFSNPLRSLASQFGVTLSSRTSAVLKILKVKSVEDLLELDPELVKNVRGFGTNTYKEVVLVQQVLKKSVGDYFLSTKARSRLSISPQRDTPKCPDVNYNSAYITGNTPREEEPVAVLDQQSKTDSIESYIKLDDSIEKLIRDGRLKLKAKAANVLFLLRIITVGQFLELDTGKINEVRGYGRTTSEELRGVQQSLKESLGISSYDNKRGRNERLNQPHKYKKDSPKIYPNKIGCFVESSHNDFGIGKLVEISGHLAKVEYFSSATNLTHRIETVDRTSLAPVFLFQNTRVYVRDPKSSAWSIGRVIERHGEDYIVQFPGRVIRQIPEGELYTRWSQPIDDPTDHLAYRINETPRFHEGRSKFVRSLIEQRGACAGMAALFSSVIDLEDYQIKVVLRVLNDPVQRYLLADEVGLGKTIEAGVIIRQYVLDRPNDHKVLLIVPNHLVSQWTEELSDKFLLGQYLDKSVKVIGTSTVVNDLDLFSGLGMLVMDEAHQLAILSESPLPSDQLLFERMKQAATTVERLLLLSATPVLHNEKAFHTMLHLLDPIIYPLDRFDSFLEKVSKRHEVAELFHGLSEETPNFFLEGNLASLKDLFPHDERLISLATDLEPFIENDVSEDDPDRNQIIRAIRTHVSEVYRLHRRMLRNRRSDHSIEILVAGRSGEEKAEFPDSSVGTIHDTLEEWRDEITSEVCRDSDRQLVNPYSTLYRIFLETLNSDLNVLDSILRARLGCSKSDLQNTGLSTSEMEVVLKTNITESEAKLLQTMRETISFSERNTNRLELLENLIGKILRQKQKAIVFSSAPLTADNIFDNLIQKFPDRIYRHHLVNIKDKSASGWVNFRFKQGGSVLVCDKFAEDGLNLQGGDCTIIHYDLPFSPNRIEQRIGRVDRYGRGDAVKSVVILCQDSPLIQAWCSCLDSAFRVFDRSIASLQLLIEDQIKKLFSTILIEGETAILNITKELAGADGQIEQELRKIALQDALDSLVDSSHDTDEMLERLAEVDGKWKEIRDASDSWIVNQLQFEPWDVENKNGGKTVRYKFRLNQKGNNTLVSVQDFIKRFMRSVDRNCPGFDSEKNLVTHAFSYNRATAQSQGVRLARIGEDFIDSMMDYVRWDDRGTSFGLWRYTPGYRSASPAELAFRFDFLVEVDMKPFFHKLTFSNAVTEESIQRRADYSFPPIIRSVWLDEDLKMIRDTEFVKALNSPYRPAKEHYIKSDYADFNLNAERWEMLEDLYDPDSWSSLCLEARRVAEIYFKEDIDLRTLIEHRIESCRAEAMVHLSQLKSRIVMSGNSRNSYDQEQLAFEELLLKCLLDGIKSPRVRLDSLGAIFVSNQNPF